MSDCATDATRKKKNKDTLTAWHSVPEKGAIDRREESKDRWSEIRFYELSIPPKPVSRGLLNDLPPLRVDMPLATSSHCLVITFGTRIKSSMVSKGMHLDG